MIEMRLPLSVLDDDTIRQHFAAQWAQEKRKVKPEVLDDDVHFVANAMAQYWAMREAVPFIVVAQEPQAYNLSAGYGGSADVLMWFLGEWKQWDVEEETSEGVIMQEGWKFCPLPAADKMMKPLQQAADKGVLTLADVKKIGGQLAVGDWKTSKGVYTSHVVQTIAYMSAEFVASDGVIDKRLSDLLNAANLGMVIQIRPDHWEVDLFEQRQDVLRAFLGSVAFARFLAQFKEPTELFIHSISGKAAGTSESKVEDEE
jgi:hypothetical protein